MEPSNFTRSQVTAMVILRMLIGWHFLFEGVLKIYNPIWTAKGYLLGSQGPFQNLFLWMAGDSIIGYVDFLNVFGLTAIGIALILGFAERPAAVGGIILLLFYYLSQPPFMDLTQIGTEGNYWVVNKNLIEAAALLVIYFHPSANLVGIQVLFKKQKASTQTH